MNPHRKKLYSNWFFLAQPIFQELKKKAKKKYDKSEKSHDRESIHATAASTPAPASPRSSISFARDLSQLRAEPVAQRHNLGRAPAPSGESKQEYQKAPPSVRARKSSVVAGAVPIDQCLPTPTASLNLPMPAAPVSTSSFSTTSKSLVSNRSGAVTGKGGAAPPMPTSAGRGRGGPPPPPGGGGPGSSLINGSSFGASAPSRGPPQPYGGLPPSPGPAGMALGPGSTPPRPVPSGASPAPRGGPPPPPAGSMAPRGGAPPPPMQQQQALAQAAAAPAPAPMGMRKAFAGPGIISFSSQTFQISSFFP